MPIQLTMRCSAALAVCLIAALPAVAQGVSDRKQDEQAIRAASKDYLAALAKGDAKAIAAFWTRDGQFIDAEGTSTSASQLAADAAQNAGKPARGTARIIESTIRFLTADVAIEDGVSEVSGDEPGEPVEVGQFHATWVKQDGRWRLGSLSESRLDEIEPARLTDLGWMTGHWSAASDKDQFHLHARWNATGTYLLRDTTIERDGATVFHSTQRIGRDPLTGKLRSWSFSDDGGYNQASWSGADDTWIEQVAGVAADGQTYKATNRVEFDGQGRFVLKTQQARMQGKAVPDREVVFTRSSAEGK